MSTWHSDESIEEVLSFALHFTDYPDILILIIGQDAQQREEARLEFQTQT